MRRCWRRTEGDRSAAAQQRPSDSWGPLAVSGQVVQRCLWGVRLCVERTRDQRVGENRRTDRSLGPYRLSRLGGCCVSVAAAGAFQLGERSPQAVERTVGAALRCGGGDTEEISDLVQPEFGFPTQVQDLPVLVA